MLRRTLGAMRYDQTYDHVLDLQETAYLSGMATRGVRVYAGGDLYASGVISDGVVVDVGGRASLSGLLSGPSVVRGVLDVSGKVDGPIRIEEDGMVIFAVGCMWNGRILQPDGRWATPTEPVTVMIDDSTPRYRMDAGGELTLL
ncbi:hypothetical protein BJF81_11635 [Ornithinimicrobium sp. CNJ-824]|nr:hypothetical protein BJF81_11635 [Ornithinimicrobium sp. CNJ-824]